MSGPPALRIPRKSFVAILLILVSTLTMEAWSTVRLRDAGINERHALNLVRLLSLPSLALFAWLVVRKQRDFLREIYSTNALTPRVVFTGIAVGLLARLAAWAQITARRSFDRIVQPNPASIEGPTFSFECPALEVVAVAILVWMVVVPLTEEFVHRGLILSAFVDKGPTIAVLVSTTIFTLTHRPDSYVWVFLFGLVFGIQYWNTKTLWLPIITHATYDALIPIDKICLQILWNPSSLKASAPLLGIVSVVIGMACAGLILYLTSKRWVEPP